MCIKRTVKTTYKHDANLRGLSRRDLDSKRAIDRAALLNYLASLHKHPGELLTKVQEHAIMLSVAKAGQSDYVDAARAFQMDKEAKQEAIS